MNAHPDVLNFHSEKLRSETYNLILPEMKALDPKVVVTVNVDVLAVVKTSSAPFQKSVRFGMRSSSSSRCSGSACKRRSVPVPGSNPFVE